MDLVKDTVSKGISYIFPGKCFDELVVKHNFDNADCSSLVLSRLLGLGLTVGSSFLFIPQILKIHNGRSAEGISLCSFFLSFLAAAATVSYSYAKNFVFGQYGDSFFVALQLMIIIMQILYFSPNSAYVFPFFSLCWAGFFAVQGGYIPLNVLYWLQAAGIPIIVISKSLQIYDNHRARSTGQLSIVSVFMQVAGTVVRVFTSIKETGDPLLIGMYVSAATLNIIVLAQFFIYGKTDKKDKKKKKQ